MRKHLLSLAVATALALPVSALADGPIDGSVYGKINVSLENYSDDVAGTDVINVNSNASRYGFTGKTKLSADGVFQVIYKLEYEALVDNDSGSTVIKSRNMYVGLQGGFGTVFAGKNDTPLKLAQNNVDLFNDYTGDIKNVLEGETRPGNVVFYSTPSMGGLQFNVASIQEEVATDSNKDGLFDQWSASVTYKPMDNLFLAFAHDSNVKSGSFTSNYVDINRLVAEWKLADITLGAMWQSAEAGDSWSNAYENDGWLLSAAWKIDNLTLKAQHTTSERDDINSQADMTSFGADYSLGKNTKLFTFYTMFEQETNNVTAKEWDTLGVGMEHKF